MVGTVMLLVMGIPSLTLLATYQWEAFPDYPSLPCMLVSSCWQIGDSQLTGITTRCGKILVYDAARNQVTICINNADYRLSCAALDAEGNRVAVGTDEKAVLIFNPHKDAWVNEGPRIWTRLRIIKLQGFE